MVKKKRDLPHHIIDATMELAAERGWNAVSLADIADRAKLPLSEVYEHFSSKGDIVDAMMSGFDEKMLHGESDAEASTRDRLFDVVMRRIDAMTPYKDGIRALLRDGGADPWSVLCSARHFLRSMALMLEAGGVSSTGLGGLLRTEGMAVLYLNVLRIWLQDDTPDMSRTMAALDKNLRRAEGWASTLWRGSSRGSHHGGMSAGGMSPDDATGGMAGGGMPPGAMPGGSGPTASPPAP